MAITVTTPQAGKYGFIVNGQSGDASGCEQLVAAPATGYAIYLDRITINAGAAITVTIGAGETGGAVTAALLGPLTMAENSSVSFEFGNGGLKLTDATALVVDTSGAGAVCIVAQGRVE